MAKSNALELSIRIAGKVDNSLTAAIKTAKNQTSGLARGVSTFAKTSAAALVGVTAAVVGVATTCGKQAADVEKAMAQTRTLLTGTADKTQARTAELTQDVMNISRVTGRVSTEIAAGSYQVISAFQDTADTASILETATKAAIAGQAETVDTVNALAAVTKAYGDTSARAVTHVSDLSFETIRLGQTTMPELANGIQKASGSAAALHVSQEELYAGFATLTGVIGNTDTVGTALNTLYTKMLKPSKALSKAVESLGYKSAYAMVQQEGLGGTIKKLGQYAGGDATKFAALFSMRDLKAAQGILNTMDVYEQKLSELQDADGATDRAFMTSINNWNDMFGIDDDDFVRSTNHLVWVLQKNTYVRERNEGGYRILRMRCHPSGGYEQWPQGTDRTGKTYPYIANPKYFAGMQDDGKIGGHTGLAPVNYKSHTQLVQLWRSRGSQYAGASGNLLKWQERMIQLKYARKGNSGTIEGCTSYNYQYTAAIDAEGVNYFPVTTEQAANLLIDSYVAIGTHTKSTTDRNDATLHDIQTEARITRIQNNRRKAA